jgi:hypothetical protein
MQIVVLAEYDRGHTLEAWSYTLLSLGAAQLLGLVMYGPIVL